MGEGVQAIGIGLQLPTQQNYFRMLQLKKNCL